MSCEGYEHGTQVVLTMSISGVPVPVGTKGLVLQVNPEQHKIDVNFIEYGVFMNIDAHSFKPMTGGEDQSSGGMMEG